MAETNFADNGNITDKTDAGIYEYGSTKTHAVTQINEPQSTIPLLQQDISYNSFNKANEIREGNKKLLLIYGPDEQRRIMEEYTDNNLQKNTYYIGKYEEVVISGQITKKTHYIAGFNGLTAVMITDANQNNNLYYICKDHLGSITALVNQSGTIEEEYNYDAWGRRRNPSNWSYTVTTPTLITRGYTTHEHLDEFGLINMNGRLYDPVVGRMLSPDKYVQNTTATQNYNRYSYAINNPLKYKDPSGWLYLGQLNTFYSSGGNNAGGFGVQVPTMGTDKTGFLENAIDNMLGDPFFMFGGKGGGGFTMDLLSSMFGEIVAGYDFPWMTTAENLQSEWSKATDAEKIALILKINNSTTGLKNSTDLNSWCAAFVYYCIQQSIGFPEPNTNGAYPWNYANSDDFQQTENNEFVEGAIVLVMRNGKFEHAGFADHQDNNKVYILGGNQGMGDISVDRFSKNSIFSFYYYFPLGWYY